MKSSRGSWWMFFWNGKSIELPLYSMNDFFSTLRTSWPGMRVAEPRLDLGVLEVEEVPRVVPDEAVLLDRLAVAADLGVGLEDEVVVVASFAERCSGREACNPSAEDECAHLLHRGEP